jgi:hypothetical protein
VGAWVPEQGAGSSNESSQQWLRCAMPRWGYGVSLSYLVAGRDNFSEGVERVSERAIRMALALHDDNLARAVAGRTS